MPSHQNRRDPLPADYQFGDAREPMSPYGWTEFSLSWNVIEGESFQSFHDKQAIEAQLADSEPT
jgi:hypothetical protein